MGALYIIDFPMACHEFMSHVLFEKILEIYKDEIPSIKERIPAKGLSYEELSTPECFCPNRRLKIDPIAGQLMPDFIQPEYLPAA
mgnify:CR=1 FL=1